jgi:hypothetical protein
MLRAALVLCLALIVSVPASALIEGGRFDWKDYRNERFGFVMRYPAAVFTRQRSSGSADGDLFETEDGKARLLVGALPNRDRFTPGSYQEFIAQQSYPGLNVDYAPVRATWTVLSGTIEETMIYEKAMFSCGGNLISTFAMTYPVAERQFYDRVVEAIEKTFRPGRHGCDQFGPSF